MKTLQKATLVVLLSFLALGTTSIKAGQGLVNANLSTTNAQKPQCYYYYSVVSYETKTDCNGCLVSYKVTKWYYYGWLVRVCREVIEKSCGQPQP